MKYGAPFKSNLLYLTRACGCPAVTYASCFTFSLMVTGRYAMAQLRNDRSSTGGAHSCREHPRIRADEAVSMKDRCPPITSSCICRSIKGPNMVFKYIQEEALAYLPDSFQKAFPPPAYRKDVDVANMRPHGRCRRANTYIDYDLKYG